MQKKSKKQRKNENKTKKEKLQKKPKMEIRLYTKGQENEYENIQNKLQKVDESKLSEREKLIQYLIILNPQKVKEGDIVIEEETNILYYSKMLNIEEFKEFSYPKGYKLKYPRIISNNNGVEESFMLRRA